MTTEDINIDYLKRRVTSWKGFLDTIDKEDWTIKQGRAKIVADEIIGFEKDYEYQTGKKLAKALERLE